MNNHFFNAENAYKDFVAKHHLPNPWLKIQRIQNKNTTGYYSKEDLEQINYWQNQANIYREQRKMWIAKWLLENESYDIAVEYVTLNNDDNNDLVNWFSNIFPCEYNFRCNIFCKNYENCLREGFK